MYPHRIRLRHPWEREALGASTVLFRRRFGYPGRIDYWERVWLTFDNLPTPSSIRLNGHDLGRHETASFDIEVTSLLQQRNRLEIINDAPSLSGDVALEVRCSAYLRNVRLTENGAVAGAVVGTADGPLELYVIGESGTLAYQVIGATPEGQPFVLPLDEPHQRADALRVELVNVATVWYTAQVRAAT